MMSGVMRTSIGLIAAAAISAFVSVPSALGQADGPPYSIPGDVIVPWTKYGQLLSVPNIPSTIAASTTATNEVILDVRNVDTVAFFLQGSLLATNPAAGGLVLPYVTSLDGTNYTSSPVGSIALTLTGTLTLASMTNANFDNIAFVKITGFQNTATNIVATNSIKLQAFAKPTTGYSRSR